MSEQRRKRNNSNIKSRSSSGESLHKHSPTGSSAKKSNSKSSSNDSISNGNQSQRNGSAKPSIQRTTSHDRVRKIVQKEGRAARNLIAWSVPVDDEVETSVPPKSKPQSPRKTQKSLLIKANLKAAALTDDASSVKSGSRPSSVNSLSSRKGDVRARYWAFLFDNLQRAVDEIYNTCEADESEVECKEVIMLLEQCTKDFKSLIERLHLLAQYETAKEGGKRPTSLAWEVRKTSPGKSFLPGGGDRNTPSPAAQRCLNFALESPRNTPTPPFLNSWADRVRGLAPPPLKIPVVSQPPVDAVKPSPTKPTPPEADQDEGEGWETVGRKTRSKSSPTAGTPPSKNTYRHGRHKNGPNKPTTQTGGGGGGGAGQRSNQLSKKGDKNQSSQVLKPLTVQVGNHGDGKTMSYSDVARNRLGNQVPSPGRERALSGDSAWTLPSPKQIHTTKSLPAINSEDHSPSSPQKLKASVSHDHTSLVSRQELNDPSIIEVGVKEKRVSTPDGKTNGGLLLTALPQRADNGAAPCGQDVNDSDDELLAAQLQSALESVVEGATDADDEEEEELNAQLDEEREQALQSAIKEEENYLKEIEKEESREIVVETESEVESELMVQRSANQLTTSSLGSLEFSQSKLDWDSMLAKYEAESEFRRTHSWGDLVDEAETEQERQPGHAVHMHEKLSSPSRKRSLTESKKRHEEKQAKAQELREKLNQDKSERLRDLSRKVEEVRALKDELLNEKRVVMERRLMRAEEKRRLALKNKVKKAHEEETKANEIAFINTLEAQNKRHDILSKHKGIETRLHDLQEERQRKMDEKAAKEAAVEERRKALEAERTARLQEMQEKRKLREEKIEQQQLEKEKERLEMARAKEKEREERIAALNAQQQAHIEELQKKIQQKQTATQRRHNENLDNIRMKAFEMSVLKHSTEDHNDVPRLAPYDKKKHCSVCNVLIPSEVYLLSHLRGKKHQESLQQHSGNAPSKQDIEAFNLKHIKDAPSNSPDPQEVSERERHKAMKKRCKKLRQRMMARGAEYDNVMSQRQEIPQSQHKVKLQKIVKDVSKFLQTRDKGPWPQNKISSLDRGLNETRIILERKVPVDQVSFRICGGLNSLLQLLNLIMDSTSSLPPVVPPRSLCSVCHVFRLGCRACYDNCHYLLFSNKISSLVDVLHHQLCLFIPDDMEPRPQSVLNASLNQSMSSSRPVSALGVSPAVGLPSDPVATSLIQVVATTLSCLSRSNPAGSPVTEKTLSAGDSFLTRANDIVSYLISVGVVDKISQYFNGVRGPINDDHQVAEFLQHSMGLLVAMTRLVYRKHPDIFSKRKADDTTQLIHTFQATELVGIVSLLYGMLLHSEAPARGEAPPPELPQHTVTVAVSGIRLLNHMARLDLDMFQKSLGEEGISLQYRHISSYLLWYCTHCMAEELLHEVILCVGYFTVLNSDNQVVIQSGQSPTVLQQLCSLPFQYFSDPRLINVLFPTLIMSSYDNRENTKILEQELSCALLANFIEEKSLESQQANLQSQSPKKSPDKDNGDARMVFSARFPESKWSVAKEYFSQK